MPDPTRTFTADDPRTPPNIVAESMMPATALSFFVAQELEVWGFGINSGDGCLIVRAGDHAFRLTIEEDQDA